MSRIQAIKTRLKPCWRAGQMAERLNQAVDALAEDQRQALLLREVDGLSYEEIGELMQCAPARCARASSALGRRWRQVRPLLDRARGAGDGERAPSASPSALADGRATASSGPRLRPPGPNSLSYGLRWAESRGSVMACARMTCCASACLTKPCRRRCASTPNTPKADPRARRDWWAPAKPPLQALHSWPGLNAGPAR